MSGHILCSERAAASPLIAVRGSESHESSHRREGSRRVIVSLSEFSFYINRQNIMKWIHPQVEQLHHILEGRSVLANLSQKMRRRHRFMAGFFVFFFKYRDLIVSSVFTNDSVDLSVRHLY